MGRFARRALILVLWYMVEAPAYPEKVAEMEWPRAYAHRMEPCRTVFFVHALILGSGFFRDPIYEPFQSYLGNPDALREHSLRLLEQTGAGQ